jgi:hypothetical protein
MIQRPAWFPVSLLAIALAAAPAGAQQSDPAGHLATQPTTASHPLPAAASAPASVHSAQAAPAQRQTPAVEPPIAQDSVSTQQPQIIVTAPPPATNTWQWHERVAWAASVVLAVLGYVGIILALRALNAIKRSNEASLETARAALSVADTLIGQTKALLEFERPWILVYIDPSLTAENSFKVMASNRGRRPARITYLADQVHIVPNESELPATPDIESMEAQEQEEPVILLPGESTAIARFTRTDVAQICKTEEQMRRVATWQEIIYLSGRVTYCDVSPANPSTSPYQTDWCCRYIHGETKSALVVGGPQSYNRHI